MKVSIVDIVKNIFVWDKKLEIYTYGEDNAYPLRVDLLRNNSITTKMASELMINYIIGNGFGIADNYKINNDEKLIDFANDLTFDIVNFRGCAIHFDYDLNYEPINPTILPFGRVRVGKKDSKEYNGKLLYKTDWQNTKEDAISYDVYNDDKKIVVNQIERAGSIEQYKGQILYINLDKRYHYPLSRFDSVLNDCDSEAQSAVYRNQLLRKGFFGKQIIVTPPLVSNDLPIEVYNEALGRLVPNDEYRRLEDEATEVKETIESFIGAENAGGAMMVQLPDFEGKIDDVFKVIKIDSTLDDKMFSYTETQVSANILMAFNNVPVSLVKSPDSSLFGSNGDALLQAQKMYWRNCTKDRQIVERIINDIVQNQITWQGDYIEFLNIIEESVNTSENDVEKLKAQASLKGSVGGVQGILAIQASVSQGLTDYESAITILNEIYGIDDNLARQMLGTPKIEKL